eukprot:2445892-Pleurochrysis_carterae.AAC.1
MSLKPSLLVLGGHLSNLAARLQLGHLRAATESSTVAYRPPARRMIGVQHVWPSGSQVVAWAAARCKRYLPMSLSRQAHLHPIAQTSPCVVALLESCLTYFLAACRSVLAWQSRRENYRGRLCRTKSSSKRRLRSVSR